MQIPTMNSMNDPPAAVSHVDRVDHNVMTSLQIPVMPTVQQKSTIVQGDGSATVFKFMYKCQGKEIAFELPI